MKHIFKFSVLLTVLLLASCLLEPLKNMMSNEDHAIISAVLDSLYSEYTEVTVSDRNETPIDIWPVSRYFEHDSIAYDTTAIIDYYLENEITSYLDKSLLPDNVKLKNRALSEGWFVSFSRPGISDDGVSAVLEGSDVSGPLCGTGFAVLLEKREGEWYIKKILETWIS